MINLKKTSTGSCSEQTTITTMHNLVFMVEEQGFWEGDLKNSF